MAALVESSITVTFPNPPGTRLIGRQRVVGVKLAFGDGALTYTTGGIALNPVTSAGKYGMYREVQYFIFHDQSSQGLNWYYDTTNKKLKAFATGAVTGPTAAPAAGTVTGALQVDSAAAETVIRLIGTVASTTIETGPEVEVKNLSAIPAQVLIGIAVGW